MPTRQTRKKDPFQRIHSWDDGYEYVRDMPPPPSDSRNAAPFYSPPLGANRGYYEPEPPRRSKSRRDDEGYPRGAYPDGRDRDQPRRRQQSPPPYREARSPSPRRRDAWQPEPSSRHHQRRHSLDSRDSAPLPRSKSTREARPPSPYRHRDRDRDYRRSDRDLRDDRDRPRDRDLRDRERDRRHTHSPPSDRPRHRHRSPSPPLNTHHPRDTRHEGSGRPPLVRSKTTTAAGAAHAAKERFDNLSPQWKAAAMAAFQAGSMAAIGMRSQPGGWNGEKGAKIAKAALGAAAMGALKGDNGKKKSGGGGSGGEGRKKSSAMDGIPGMVGGFLVDQLSKQREKKKH